MECEIPIRFLPLWTSLEPSWLETWAIATLNFPREGQWAEVFFHNSTEMSLTDRSLYVPEQCLQVTLYPYELHLGGGKVPSWQHSILSLSVLPVSQGDQPFSRLEHLILESLKEWELNSSGVSTCSGPFCHRLQWGPCPLNPHSVWIRSVGCVGWSGWNNVSSLINNSNTFMCSYVIPMIFLSSLVPKEMKQ